MRAFRRGIAFLLVAGLLAAQGAVWVAAHHATLEDDAACAGTDGPTFVGPHHRAGLQYEDTNPPNPIEHCALCHLQRAVSGARLSRVQAISTAPHVVGAPGEPAFALTLVVLHEFSPRGPPSTFTSL